MIDPGRSVRADFSTRQSDVRWRVFHEIRRLEMSIKKPFDTVPQSPIVSAGLVQVCRPLVGRGFFQGREEDRLDSGVALAHGTVASMTSLSQEQCEKRGLRGSRHQGFSRRCPTSSSSQYSQALA